MQIISWNVNGIRAANRQGFLDWLNKARPDIVCLQEIKAHKEQLIPELLQPKGYYSYWGSGEMIDFDFWLCKDLNEVMGGVKKN